ncbi:MAG TPA: TerB family tellurite resistance protein [bacterium]|nr:TerB family tellurite resistance protein [bacterium]
MFEKLKQFLHESVHHANVAERLPEDQVAVAAILLEVAEADRNFAPEEFREIIIQLRAYFGMSKEEVEDLLATASQAREKATDLFPFTNAIARTYAPDRKQEVLTMVWQVIFSDDRLDPFEDQLAGRLQTLLSVNHSVLIDAKEKAREIQRARADRSGVGSAPRR